MKTNNTAEQSTAGEESAQQDAAVKTLSTSQPESDEQEDQSCEPPEQVRKKTTGSGETLTVTDTSVAKNQNGELLVTNGDVLETQSLNSSEAACSKTDSSVCMAEEEHTEVVGGVSGDVDDRVLRDCEAAALNEEVATDSSDDAESEEVETDGDAHDGDAAENVPPSSLQRPLMGNELAGPDRNRRRMARQRRQNSQMSIAIGGPVFDRWRQIGAQWGLSNDSDIARVLLQHYEDIQAGRPPRPPPAPRCLGCGERLVPLPCEACGPNQHSNRVSHDRGGGGGFGGGSGDRYCGRCRD